MESIMLQTSSILVIDQHPAIAGVLEDILTDAGYSVSTVRNDADARLALAHHPPALILLDVGHTGMRGIPVIEHVRTLGLATLPIVAMTTAQSDVAPEIVPGVVECLAKPFNLDDLLACVARYVQPHTAAPAALARG